MISDSAGHVAKNQSGLPPGRKGQCIPAQRAFLSSSSMFPFLLDCWVCYSQVRPTKNPRMTAITSHCTLPAQLADGAAWLGGGVLLHSATASSSSSPPSVPLRKSSGHPKQQTGREMKGEERTLTHTNQICRYNSCSNKRIQERGKKEKKRKRNQAKYVWGLGWGARAEKNPQASCL